MSNRENGTRNATQNVIGLDIGTSRIVTARRANDQYQFATQLNAFLTLPYSKITAGVLEKEKIPHQVEGAEMIVYGNESEKFANMLHVETRRPMMRGILNPGETNSLGMIRQIVATLIPAEQRKGGRLCFSLPGAPIGAADDLTYHEATLRQIFTEMGFEVTSINEGLAVVLAELDGDNYTGIGISCGGGMCNVCFAYLSLPVFSFSVPKAGDFIDASAASVVGERATLIRTIKEESFHLNGTFTDKIQQALAVYYDDMIRGMVNALRDTLAQTKNVPRLGRPVPVVISGGSAMPAGFRERVQKFLAESPLPIAISEVRMAADPLHSTAKGALVSALADA